MFGGSSSSGEDVESGIGRLEEKVEEAVGRVDKLIAVINLSFVTCARNVFMNVAVSLFTDVLIQTIQGTNPTTNVPTATKHSQHQLIATLISKDALGDQSSSYDNKHAMMIS